MFGKKARDTFINKTSVTINNFNSKFWMKER